VPVGLIDLNMGVYFAIGWLSDEALNASIEMLANEKELRWLIDDMRQMADARDSGEAQRELDAYYADLVAKAKGKPVRPKPSLGLHPIDNPKYPCGGYNAVIHPLRQRRVQAASCCNSAPTIPTSRTAGWRSSA
jgi:hypothetical protein